MERPRELAISANCVVIRPIVEIAPSAKVPKGDSEYSGLRLDVDAERRRNWERYGTAYHINNGPFDLDAERAKRKENAERETSLTPDEIVVPQVIRLWTKAGFQEAQRLIAEEKLTLNEDEERAVARYAVKYQRAEEEQAEIKAEVAAITSDWQQRWIQGDVEHFQKIISSDRTIRGSKVDLQYQYLGRNVHAFNKVGGKERVQKRLTPPKSQRIVGDVFEKLVQVSTDRKFEVIMVDPPIKMGGADPVRGVALKYSGLSEKNYLEKFGEMVQKQNQ